MLASQPLRCVSDVDTGDTCLSGAQIAGYNVTNTAWTLNYKLASGGRRTRALIPGTDFGNPGTSPFATNCAHAVAGYRAARQPNASRQARYHYYHRHQLTGYGPCNSIGSASAPAWVRPG